MVWEGGYGTVDALLEQSATQATREFTHLDGDPPSVGTRVDVDPWIYPDEFAASHGPGGDLCRTYRCCVRVARPLNPVVQDFT